MKSSLESLTPKEKKALALIYGTDGYKALERVHELEKHGLGQDALVAPTMEAVNYLKGRAFQSKFLLSLIKDCFKQTEKS